MARKPPSEPKVHLNIALPMSVRMALDAYATKNERSMSFVATQAITKLLAENSAPKVAKKAGA